jgi:predicted nucleic acid-binding protein
LTVFVDTSAFYALLSRDDRYHSRAVALWQTLRSSDEERVSTNYVALEVFALVQRRLGMEAARRLQEDLLPLVRVAWVTEAEHRAAVASVLAAGRRGLSLVDAVSFVAMRRLGATRAFAFDPDFRQQGFEVF